MPINWGTVSRRIVKTPNTAPMIPKMTTIRLMGCESSKYPMGGMPGRSESDDVSVWFNPLRIPPRGNRKMNAASSALCYMPVCDGR